MKCKSLIIFSLLLAFSCVQQEEEQMGFLSFSALELNQFNGYNPTARTSSVSEWQHIFNSNTEVQIIGNGRTQSLMIDPGDFFLPYQTQLSFGIYEYLVEQEGEQYMDYLPFVAQGNFDMGNLNYNIILQGETDYGLITVKNDMIEEVLLDGEVTFTLTEDEEFFFKYVRGGEVYSIEIQSAVGDESFVEEIEVQAYEHHHFYLTNSGASFVELLIGDFTYEERQLDIGQVNNIIYDYDGNAYRTVRIGNQTWMAQNLKTTSFCNGDPIENVPGGEAWITLDEPAYTYYDNDERYDRDYGKLYNEYAVIDERNVCPCGWKVPSLEEYNELLDFISDDTWTRGGLLKRTGYDYWLTPNSGASDEFGFSAMPGGMFTYTSYSDELADVTERGIPRLGFAYLGIFGPYWTSTKFDWYDDFNEVDRENYRVMMLNYISTQVFTNLEAEVMGIGVRCIKEN